MKTARLLISHDLPFIQCTHCPMMFTLASVDNDPVFDNAKFVYAHEEYCRYCPYCGSRQTPTSEGP